MGTAKSILESRQSEIGRDAKVAVIQKWAAEFFAGVGEPVADNDGDVFVGGSEEGWMFRINFKKSYLIVDCDSYSNAEWQDTEKLQVLYAEIEIDTIGQVLEEHFESVIAKAKFIKV